VTDEEVLKMYEEMVEYYGEKLPNPEHHPIQFAYYVKLWKYYKERRENDK
jgi:hypothetical protein